MRVEIQHALVESKEAVYPIRYEQGGHLHHVPMPLVRVTTCGAFHLEVVQDVISVDPPLGRYQVITLEQRPRGSRTGLTLLKMLASRPEHYASKDWLAEYIPRMRSSEDEEEEGWGRGLVRIDNVVSLLRSLLCPPGIAQGDAARKRLVAYIKNHKDSGPGYQLAPLPLLWLDVDVIATTVQQACRQEQEGRDALAAWEQVYALAAKGSYLPQEPYSDWATDKRAEIDGYLKQAVLALRRLLLAQYGEASEERVLMLLRSYWQMHPTDEDMVRPLMELLGKRECVQEALECYQRLCEQMEQEGGTPHLCTQQTAHDVRTRQNRGNQTIIHTTNTALPLNSPSVFPSNQQDSSFPFIRQVFSENIVGVVSTPSLAYQHLAGIKSEDQPGGEWLLSGASFLAPLFDRGRSFDALLETLHIVLPVVKALQIMTRHQFVQNSATPLMGSIPSVYSKRIPEEERIQLCQVFSESIIQGWRFFGSSNNTLALSLAQAQLSLIQHAHSLLYPGTLPFLYTGAYSLIGITLHFQERDQEALHAHQSGYIAALAIGDLWYVVQSLICQSDCYHFLGQYDVAIQIIEEALHTIGVSSNNAHVCAKAHLLTCWADNAMALKDYRTAQEKLEASAVYLDHIAPNEEFDGAAWHMVAGKYSLMTKGYTTALDHFQESLAVLPEMWILRRIMTSIGLMKAYARLKERDQSLILADEVAPMVQSINARMTTRWFNEYLQEDLLETFPTDERVRTFVRNTYQRFPQLIDISST
ncbi:MAG: hypothetical protein H0U76_04625 [Ktedonobacteraceae bacterium]|nr:hypothetical protein [Ktedonobacteraceae bacterium]